MVLSDNGMESYVFPVADLNGAAKPEQSKTVNITANGTQTVTPDSGKVLSSVVINTNVSAPAVQTQEKSVTITQNGASEVTPDTGKYLSKVSITTNVPNTPTPTQEKTQEITTNTTTTISPDEGYALSSVTVITNIPATPTQTKTVEISANGQTTVSPDAGYNLSGVTVNVDVPAPASKLPSVIDKSVTARLDGDNKYRLVCFLRLPKPHEHYRPRECNVYRRPRFPMRLGDEQGHDYHAWLYAACHCGDNNALRQHCFDCRPGGSKCGIYSRSELVELCGAHHGSNRLKSNSRCHCSGVRGHVPLHRTCGAQHGYVVVKWNKEQPTKILSARGCRHDTAMNVYCGEFVARKRLPRAV